MSNSIIIELIIILFLVSLNGLFAMSEIAIVSVRKPRLQQRVEKGDKRAELALQLAKDPENFLSTVQIGITLIGILAGVFGGATLAEDLAALLIMFGLPTNYSNPISVTVVVAIITYLTLIIGELVPKSVALQNAEQVATAVAPFMHRLGKVMYPFVWLLSISTQLITRLLGSNVAQEPTITGEEIEIMLQQGAEEGVFDPEEPEIVKRIFRLSDRTVKSLMTPRREIVWLDPLDALDQVRQKIMAHGYSRYPVAEGNLDHVIGYIEVKDMVKYTVTSADFSPFEQIYDPLYIPETMHALELLERFKAEHVHLALVFDEYGGLEGLITSTDLLEAIVGNINVSFVSRIIPRDDGSWLVDGALALVELLEFLGMDEPMQLRHSGRYQTVGGFVLAMAKGIPAEGELFHWEGVRFEVVDMDGFRVDKLLVSVVGP